MQHTSYPRNYVPTKQQNFDNPRKTTNNNHTVLTFIWRNTLNSKVIDVSEKIKCSEHSIFFSLQTFLDIKFTININKIVDIKIFAIFS